MSNDIPRPEHPKPQFMRTDWLNLNGTWTCEFDYGKSGDAHGYAQSTGFSQNITVPFCVESELSGIGHTDFIECLWYHRTFTVPAGWDGKDVVLRFGAVDYHATAFVNGVKAGEHWGGSASFGFDITGLVKRNQENHLVVKVVDELRSGLQEGGKQSHKLKSRGCLYTRVTGIWQTVWLEAVDPLGLVRVEVTPDLDTGTFHIVPLFRNAGSGTELRVIVGTGGTVLRDVRRTAAGGIPVTVELDDPHAWHPDDPFLYDVAFEVLKDGTCVDRVESYAGLRKVHIEGNRFYLNNEPFYQRLVLDQGYYPDGVWTAPSDAALKRDIELGKTAGFNGARLHQKVFEERYHYWADVLGYVTWGESPSWGMDITNPGAARNFLPEWREVVGRDRNHPSIIVWTPLNETRNNAGTVEHARLHRDVYALTKAMDTTRPCCDTAGFVHVVTDIYAVHNYTANPEALQEKLALDENGKPFRNFPDKDTAYTGQPYMVSEFGGIKWAPGHRGSERDASWGYGENPKTLDEFYARLEGQVRAIESLDHICGWCYTQLTDVEQEENGIYTYGRGEKLDMERIRRIFKV